MRMEPPPSPPWAMGTMRAATAAAEPPLEPPGVRERSQGLRVAPKSRGSVYGARPNSGGNGTQSLRKASPFLSHSQMWATPLSRSTNRAA